jgi:hypothetical protein
MRLYEDDPDDVAVMEWIKSLPTDKRGRRRVKHHIVEALLRSIEGQEPLRMERVPKVTRRDEVAREANGKEAKAVTSGNGSARKVEELPDFPAVENITF